MSQNLDFCYDADDQSLFSAEPVTCSVWQDLFEVYWQDYEPEIWENVRNMGLYPAFVEDFPKLRNIGSYDWDELSEDEQQELFDNPEYIGPSCDAGDFLKWVAIWIEILEESDDAERKQLLPMANQDSDCSEEILNDLRGIKIQAECAQKHGVTMHIILY